MERITGAKQVVPRFPATMLYRKIRYELGDTAARRREITACPIIGSDQARQWSADLLADNFWTGQFQRPGIICGACWQSRSRPGIAPAATAQGPESLSVELEQFKSAARFMKTLLPSQCAQSLPGIGAMAHVATLRLTGGLLRRGLFAGSFQVYRYAGARVMNICGFALGNSSIACARVATSHRYNSTITRARISRRQALGARCNGSLPMPPMGGA